MVSDLSLAIREVDEVIHLQEEIWHAGLCEVVGLECDPILAEKTTVQLGFNAFRIFRLKRCTKLRSQRSRNLTIWVSYISYAKSNRIFGIYF